MKTLGGRFEAGLFYDHERDGADGAYDLWLGANTEEQVAQIFG